MSTPQPSLLSEIRRKEQFHELLLAHAITRRWGLSLPMYRFVKALAELLVVALCIIALVTTNVDPSIPLLVAGSAVVGAEFVESYLAGAEDVDVEAVVEAARRLDNEQGDD